MSFKCPKCSFKGTYKQVQRHYYAKHHKYAEGTISKSKQKKVYAFHPIKGGKK